MLALTTIIKRSDGSETVSNDALIRLPAELRDAARLESYLKISTPGWSRQELGYWNYARLHENGDLYIYPAICLRNEAKPRRKFPGYVVEFSREQIERYAEQMEEVNLGHQRQVAEDFNLLIHDLRQLSTSIHHAAEEATFQLRSGDYEAAATRLQNIIATQSMLTIRTDLLDYSGNAAHFSDRNDIPVYKKVHKVVRCFAAYAADRGLNIHLEGSSYALTIGPDVFEIVPYVLLDNAIKYSPYGNDIVVSISDGSKSTTFIVKSAGPLIAPSEMRSIFDKGVRGSAARQSGVQGSGAGLFIAKRVVDQFRGTISASISDSRFLIKDVMMTDVTFTVTVPSESPRY